MCGDGDVSGNEVCDGESGCASDCLSMTTAGAIASTDPVWPRNTSSCGAGSGEFHFDTQSFVWRGEARSVHFRAQWGGFDGYLHAFEGTFNPASPEAGCLAADDDEGGTSASAVTLSLVPGDRIDLVLSTFSAGTTGAWSLTITPAP